MTLIKWAHRPTLTLFDEIDRMLNSINANYPSNFNYNSWSPQFEVLDIDSAYILRGDFPGVSKKDVNIEVSDGILTVSGERKNIDKNYSDSCDHSRIPHGKFSRSFNLPDDIKEEQINAKMKDGVLSLEIPRMAPIKPDIKKISIK